MHVYNYIYQTIVRIFPWSIYFIKVSQNLYQIDRLFERSKSIDHIIFKFKYSSARVINCISNLLVLESVYENDLTDLDLSKLTIGHEIDPKIWITSTYILYVLNYIHLKYQVITLRSLIKSISILERYIEFKFNKREDI